jgi:septal ring factor EnvC (AmiA/AmiB activator)
MVIKLLNTLVVLVLFSSINTAQSNNKIKAKSAELDNLRIEINVLEKELSAKSIKEKESLSSLEKINNQSHLITKLISRLKREEINKTKKIEEINSELKEVEKTISDLKKDYSSYVVWLYKYGGGSKLKFLLESESLNQAALRYKYLSSITETNESKLFELNESKAKYISLTNELSNEVAEKSKIVSSKTNEQRVLVSKKNDKQRIIKKIKEDKSLLTQEIQQKRKAEQEIKNLISRLIEEEIARRDSEDKNSTVKKIDYDNFENFSLLKGRMNWPVKKGKVIRKFGENLNAKLNTITVNYGVDIRTSKQSEIYAVAEGIVSAIEWIPGFGSVVILTHQDNFRTVYGHIKDIKVVEGDKIKGGDLIGRVNESLEGNILHFEIWNQRNNQNPEIWLAKK